MSFEVIKLTNEWSLATFAYIRCNNNQLDVFCTYLQYCFSKLRKPIFNIEELLNSLEQCFSLRMPNTLCESCLNLLSRQGIVEFTDKTIKVLKYEIDPVEFDARIDTLLKEERAIVNALISYALEQGRPFTYDEARHALASFLIRDNKALDIFLDDTSDLASTSATDLAVSDSTYVGMFVCDLLSKKDDERASELLTYLIRMVEGIMIYIAVCNTRSDSTNLRNVKIFLDTKLILRCLGLTDKYNKESVMQLLDLIKQCKGTVCIYDLTLEEVKSAISGAQYALLNHLVVDDRELGSFCRTQSMPCATLDWTLSNIETMLQKLGIFIQSAAESTASELEVPEKEFAQFLADNHVSKSSHGVENDAAVINFISRKQGTAKRPQIRFITSNTSLVKRTHEFFKAKDIRYPAVQAEAQLLFTLWLPKSSGSSNLPELVLARNAYVAKQPNFELKERMRQLMQDLARLYNKDLVYQFEETELFEKYIIKQCHGDLSTVTAQTLFEQLQNSERQTVLAEEASAKAAIAIADSKYSISEYKKTIEEQAALLDDKTYALTSESDLLSDEIVCNTLSKLPLKLYRFLLACIKKAPVSMSLVAAIASLTIGAYFTSVGYIIAAIFILITLGLAFLCTKMPTMTLALFHKCVKYIESKTVRTFECYVTKSFGHRLSDQTYNLAKQKLMRALYDKIKVC